MDIESTTKAPILAQQPQPIFQLFKDSFRIYAVTFKKFWWLALITGLLFFCYNSFMDQNIFNNKIGIAAEELIDYQAGIPTEQQQYPNIQTMSEQPIPVTSIISFGLIFILWNIMIDGYLIAVILHGAYSLVTNESQSLTPSFKLMFHKYGWLILADMVSWVIVMIMVAFIIAPFIMEYYLSVNISTISLLISLIWLLIATVLTTYLWFGYPLIILTEIKNPFKALIFSFQLVLNNWWRTSIYIGLVILTAFLIGGFIAILVVLLNLVAPSLDTLVDFIFDYIIELIMIYLIVSIIPIYHDLRLRYQGNFYIK